VSSVRDSKQRAAARAKLEREMAARRDAARRKRLMQARIGAGAAGVVVLAAVVWIIVAAAGDSNPTANPSAAATNCTWHSDFPSPSPGDPSPTPLPSGIKDVGTPPADPPRSGFQVLTFDTNLGQVQVEMDLSKTPCTAASMAHLAGKGFYDNTSCHRLVADIFALQCGDPSGTGSGGSTYRFDDENLPLNKLPAYHDGDVAMANTGQPGSNGTQFFFVYGNSQLQGNYSLWGRVIAGNDIVKKVAAAGDDGAYAAEAGGGHPLQEFKFNKVTAGPITEKSMASPAPSPATSPSPATTPSPSPTA
jgi:peptidyl-prolyl cis-trans isomerase B (cyclophilin B)